MTGAVSEATTNTSLATTEGTTTTDGSGSSGGSVTTTSVTTTSVTTTSVTTTGTSTSTSTSDSGSTNTSETTVGLACEGEVVNNPKCTGDTPYCVDKDCIGCASLECATIDPDKPTCEMTSGQCVECLEHSDCLSAEKPACDTDTATCKACSEHDDCKATACDLETGMCLPETCVYYVDLTKAGEFPCSDAGDGKSPESAFCTLQKAATLLQADKPCTIKVKAGTQFQTAATVIPKGNITVAIVAYGGFVPSLSVPTDPSITIQSGNRVYMNRITITNSSPSSNPAIECNDAILWLDSQRIYNTKTALNANDCRVHIRQSIIFGHTFGGLDIQGSDPAKAQLWLENSYITSMNSSIFGAIRLIGAVKADLLYSTIALVKSAVPTIECVANFSGTINIRNSAIVGAAPRYGAACMPKLTLTTSFESDKINQADLGGTFSAFNGGVYQAKVGGTLTDVASWQPGDPKVDQDDTPRPKAMGPDYAGADRPAP